MCNLLASMFDAGHWQSFKCSLHCHPRVKTREANHQFREVVNFEQSRESHFWHVTRWGIAFQERIICHVADASLEQPVTGAHAKMASYHGICWPRHAAVSESG
jgi:hypothetical protein